MADAAMRCSSAQDREWGEEGDVVWLLVERRGCRRRSSSSYLDIECAARTGEMTALTTISHELWSVSLLGEAVGVKRCGGKLKSPAGARRLNGFEMAVANCPGFSVYLENSASGSTR